jgi:hypothetical protein
MAEVDVFERLVAMEKAMESIRSDLRWSKVIGSLGLAVVIGLGGTGLQQLFSINGTLGGIQRELGTLTEAVSGLKSDLGEVSRKLDAHGEAITGLRMNDVKIGEKLGVDIDPVWPPVFDAKDPWKESP